MKVESSPQQLLLGLLGDAENSGKGPHPLPTKPTEPGFGGFGGEHPRHISENTAEGEAKQHTPSRGGFDDIGSVLSAFPGATFQGVRPKDSFQGPMPKPPRGRRCPVCAGEIHWRVIDGKEVCALCAEGGPGEIMGDRFLAALKN